MVSLRLRQATCGRPRTRPCPLPVQDGRAKKGERYLAFLPLSNPPHSGAEKPVNKPYRRPDRGGRVRHIRNLQSSLSARATPVARKMAVLYPGLFPGTGIAVQWLGPPVWQLGDSCPLEIDGIAKAMNRSLGDNCSWHSGCPPSASVPHVFNQVRTSCPVRRLPVS